MTTVYELIEQLGGEVVRGRARLRVGSDYVIIGRLNGDNMEFTEEGRRLAAGGELSGPVTTPVVESVPAEEAVEVVKEAITETVDTAIPQDLFE